MSKLALTLIKENIKLEDPFLDLGNCGLCNNIPHLLSNCTWLKGLNLGRGYRNIYSLKWLDCLNRAYANTFEGEELSLLRRLPNLQTLSLAETKITNYSFLEDLGQLQSLELSNNNIEIKTYDLLKKLPKLKSLYLSNNKIIDIEFLRNLIEIETLILYDNKIKNIDSLEDLTNLKVLDLGANNIIDIKFLKKLRKLHTLNLSNNKIESLEPLLHSIINNFDIDFNENSIFRLHNEVGLKDNPVSSPLPPFEIIKQGKEAIVNWFEDREKQGEEVVYEAKLMIIGDAGSDKTTLSSKIKDLNCPPPDKNDDTTVGIDISQFLFNTNDGKPEFRVNIWDLGGQKIYHPLHQLFFSRRSLYILVVNGREENDLEDFWIPVQELLGKESPMLILFNQHGNIQSSIAFRHLKAYYPNIKGDLSIVNLLNSPDKTKDFINEIEKFLRNLPQFEKGEKLPKLWVRIREVIAQKKDNYIELKDFRKLCSDIGIIDLKKQDFVSDYLHDLGIVLRFREDALLNKIVFLNPQWALDAIYQVLNHTRDNHNGLFKKNDLLSVWDKQEFYDAQGELLALMKKFELCYEIDSEQYLVPSLLPEDLPKDFEWDRANNTVLYYDYDFMPKGIISRLIVRLHHLIAKDKLLWREGVIFEHQGATVWLTKSSNKKIEILGKGYKPSSLITILTNEIDKINEKYHFNERSTPPVKHVPCLCEGCIHTEKPHYYKYEELITRDRLSKLTIECGKPLYHQINVKKLLENIEESNFTVSKLINGIKIFVTYCWSDAEDKPDKKHQQMVRNFVNKLREFNEFDATFDLYENQKSTSTNFIKMMYDNLSNNKKIIIVLSKGYAKKANVFTGGVGVEYQAIMNDIKDNPQKYILVSFSKGSTDIYPFGLKGTDTIFIEKGDIKISKNQEEKNRLFAKLKDETIYEVPPMGTKSAVVKKK